MKRQLILARTSLPTFGAIVDRRLLGVWELGQGWVSGLEVKDGWRLEGGWHMFDIQEL